MKVYFPILNFGNRAMNVANTFFCGMDPMAQLLEFKRRDVENRTRLHMPLPDSYGLGEAERNNTDPDWYRVW